MKTNLYGKTVLITGASSGLGAEFARQFAALGCKLILVARRLERLQKLQAEILERFNTSIECIKMDLTEPNAPEQLFTQLEESGNAVDVLINNAGFGLFGEFLMMPWEHLHRMLELDVIAFTHLAHLYANDMIKRNSGYILLISSTGAFQPTPTYAVYSAAKSYVLSLGESLHYELRHTSVKVTVLCPGSTRTEFLEVAGQRPTAFQRAVMLNVEKVVRIGIKALLKGRASVVSGGINTFFAWGTRLLPRQALAAISTRLNR
jgi:uncharacterized protein